MNQNEKILIDDGKIILKVSDIDKKNQIIAEVIQGGMLSSNKGFNLPNTNISQPALTKKDIDDAIFSAKQNVDWIALSFVRSSSDYDLVKSKIKNLGYDTPVMAKIEKWEAVNNAKKIINSFDAVMVARGDLGVEVPSEKVPLIQKKIIEKAREAGKPVVIATQLLDSMIERPVPTRAEISDIANSIFDGADALMVTGETAIGKHPKRVIKVLLRVIKETESSINYKNYFKYKRQKILNTARAISHAACSVAHDQRIETIVTMTHTGSTARMVSRYRPKSRIVAMTPFRSIARQLEIVWGIKSFVVSAYDSSDEIPQIANSVLNEEGFLLEKEKFVLTGGVPVGIKGTTNYLSVLKVNHRI